MTLSRGFGWPQIVRLGLVQAGIGAMVVLMTATLNRVMVVEFGLPASVPGVLVAGHFVVQLLRARAGFGSDRAGRRTPWIVAGMAVLAAAGIAAAAGTALLGTNRAAGLAVAAVSFVVLGVGVSVAGTPLLALLAEGVEEHRRGPAAAIVWVMMIAGFIVTTAVAGLLLDPFSPARLVAVCAGVAGVAFVVAVTALAGLERRVAHLRITGAAAAHESPPFRAALAELWAQDDARRFAVFVFLAMLAYSAQDLILEPFTGVVFGLTPGESTRISSMQHGGLLAGMVLTAAASTRRGHLAHWAAAGCLASALGFVALIAAAAAGHLAALKAAIVALGFANGVFAIGAIGAMMALVRRGTQAGAGLRMGLWGAAQAMAYAVGGLAGAALSDVARGLLGSPLLGYGSVFALEAACFVAAGVLARRAAEGSPRAVPSLSRDGDAMLAAMG